MDYSSSNKHFDSNSSNFNNYIDNNNSFFNFNQRSIDVHEKYSLYAAIITYNDYKKKLDQLEKKFLKIKMDFNSNKENIINDNYYEILNEPKSFLINDNPIS